MAFEDEIPKASRARRRKLAEVASDEPALPHDHEPEQRMAQRHRAWLQEHRPAVAG